MNRSTEYRWNLRKLMADRGMFNTTALRPLLAEHGVHLSSSQIYRLVTEKPERLSLSTLVALVEILSCTMDELIEIMPVSAKTRKTAGDARMPKTGARGPDIGGRRPVRARIVEPDA
jgi:DNA-binding Xre family transcriptional regulator